MSEDDVVALSSDSGNEGDNSTIGSRVKSMSLQDRPRLAKKSATTDAKYASLTKRQAAIVSKDKTKDLAKILHSDSDKFMENFDPENSSREKRKLDRKIIRKIPGAVYDNNGIHVTSGWDLCDCLQEACKGCYFPCPKCSSHRCGVDCRVNRKFTYEQLEYHGYDFVVKNPLFK